MKILLVGVVCFIAGFFCFYWLFKRGQKNLNALIPMPFNSENPSTLKGSQALANSSLKGSQEHKKKEKAYISRALQGVFNITSDIRGRLELYITYLKDQNQVLKQKLFLSKKISHEISSAIQEFVIILDKKGQVLFHNPQSQKIFYLEQKNPVPLQINEVVRSLDVINLFEECIQKQVCIIRNCSFRKKNQNIKSHFKVTAIPLFKNFSDSLALSEPKKAQTQLETSESIGAQSKALVLESAKPITNQHLQKVILIFDDQTATQESQQAHIDFVSNVSHELKTPLTSLQGYVEMLIQDFSNKNLDQFENFLQILLKNCKRMNSLVNDLLILSNLISQGDVEKKKLSTKEVTKKVIKSIKTGDRNLHCSFLTNHVIGHPLWVETVLHNLLDNACRHTPEKSDVHILWEKTQNKVLLKVRDTGEGIPEKYQQRVFERFFRIDPARSRTKGGTGVGLSLVKQALEKQGGSVRVVSYPSRGAEFICEFPYA